MTKPSANTSTDQPSDPTPSARGDHPAPGQAATGKETGKQAIMFTLLSLSAGVVEAVGFFLIYHFLPINYEWSHVISITLSVIYNFTLNRRYTFRSAGNVPVAMAWVALFYVFFIPATGYLGQLASNAGINGYIIKAVTMVLNFVGEFLWWKFVVFRGTENTNDLAKKR